MPRNRQVKPGRPPSGKAPSKKILLRLYNEEGKSIRDIGEALGCSKDIVARSLRSYGIEARTKARRSSLRNYDLEFLEEGIKIKGLRGFSRELRIDKSALLRHIRARKTME